MDGKIEIADDDFEIAFHIGKCCLRHSLLVSTSLKHSDTEQHYKLPDAQVDLFEAMPDEFKTSDILEKARVRGISRASVFRMLKKGTGVWPSSFSINRLLSEDGKRQKCQEMKKGGETRETFETHRYFTF